MNNPEALSLRAILAGICALASTGCSLLFINAPPERPPGGAQARAPECTSGAL
jgi:hypothetical protein